MANLILRRGAMAVLAALTLSVAMPAEAATVAPPVLTITVQPFIAVPTAPTVSYAPDYPLDVFHYGGRYYAWQGGWFVTDRPGQPWVYVSRNQVPQPVLLIPAQYYKKIPPGHVKKMDRGHGKNKHDHDHDDD